MHLGAAEGLVVGLLAGGHLHQRRPGEEHLGTFLDHHHVVAHPRDVRAAGGGIAENEGDGRYAGRVHAWVDGERLVPEARADQRRSGRQRTAERCAAGVVEVYRQLT